VDWIFPIGFGLLGAMAGAVLANQTISVWLYDIPKLKELEAKKKLLGKLNANKLTVRSYVWVAVTLAIPIGAFLFMADASWFIAGMAATLLGTFMNVKARPERLEKPFRQKYAKYLKK